MGGWKEDSHTTSRTRTIGHENDLCGGVVVYRLFEEGRSSSSSFSFSFSFSSSFSSRRRSQQLSIHIHGPHFILNHCEPLPVRRPQYMIQYSGLPTPEEATEN